MTKEIARQIENTKKKMKNHEIIERHQEIRSLDLDTLIRALYIGYEIEPEIGDLVTFEYRDAVITIGKIVEFEKEDVTYALVDDSNYEEPQKIALSDLRLATQEEAEQVEKQRIDKKLDGILLDLSNKERSILAEKLN